MEFRMYTMVLRQLSPIQKGIQALHSVVEYSKLFGDTNEYKQWADCDKTAIILDGGTSQDMIDIIKFLTDNKYNYAIFEEPDLYNSMTAISFIVPENIWNINDYPDYETYVLKFGFKQGIIDSTITKEFWAKTIFGKTYDDTINIINMRNMIYSKRLSQ